MAACTSLFLLFLALTSAGPPGPPCCPYKRVGGVGYTLLGSGPVPAACSSPCTYSRDGQPGDTYCFAPGNLQVECSPTNSIEEEIRKIAKIKEATEAALFHASAVVNRAEEVSASMTHLLDLLQPENSKFDKNEFPDSTPCSEISVIMAQHSNR